MTYNHKWLAAKVIELGGVSEFAKRTGISISGVHRWVKGERTPSPSMVARLSKHLGLTITETEVALGLSYPNRKFRELVASKGFNQNQLAKRMGYAQPNVNALINGKRAMTLRYAVHFAKALGVDVETVAEAVNYDNNNE